jgi:hypothetical protein
MQSLDWTTMLQFLNLSWQPGPFSSFPGFAVGMMSLLTTMSLLLWLLLSLLLWLLLSLLLLLSLSLLLLLLLSLFLLLSVLVRVFRSNDVPFVSESKIK